MARRVGDLVAQRAAASFVGRARELDLLCRMLDGQEPLITHIHGIAGIGKSSLLRAFEARARQRGATVISLDCRMIEPTARGFLRELGTAMGLESADPEAAAARLGELGERVVISLDTYELVRLMDDWLRQVFFPQLPDNVRVVLAGREPPVPAWWSAAGWQGLFRSMTLDPLSEEEALGFLAQAGIGPIEARQINRVTQGHPLALQLAGSARAEHPDVALEEAALQRVVAELTRLYLLEIDDPRTRQVLEAASVVRRATLPLIAAMLPDVAPQDAFQRLRALPFVDLVQDGLHIHDAIQHAIATSLKASDPERYRAYRRAAWRSLRRGVGSADPADLWRYTADMLYIIENPILREGFFPSGAQSCAFGPPRPGDDDSIREIITTTEGPESAAHLLRLWEGAPHVFHVGRDQHGSIAGFYCLFQPDQVDQQLLAADPVLRRWMAHLNEEAPLPRGQVALFVRRWLSRERGEQPAPAQGAAWLDMKRIYMELRPRLRRVYMVIWDVETYGETAQQLGFELLPDPHVTLDGRTYYSAANDFGPGSVDGWLARLVGIELGEMVERGILDVDARELVLNGARTPLTRLEFGTFQYLYERAGRAVGRDELLDAVWGQDYVGGSNVVDAVIRTLRRKLGDRSSSIETVWGIGYRYREP